jgi:hypothetical protein
MDENVSLASNATFALCQHVTKEPELKSEIIRLAESKIPEVCFEIVSFVRGEASNFLEWYQEAILKLVGYPLDKRGITDCLDSIYYDLVKKGSEELVAQFLRSWISAHSSKEHRDHKIYKELDLLFFEIQKRSELVGRLLLDWLNDDDPKFHHCASELVEIMRTHRLRPVSFGSSEISKLQQVDLVFLVRKILGYIIDFDYSAALIFSILKHESIDSQKESLVVELFVEHLGSDHLYRAIEFLEKKSKEGSLSTVEKKVIAKCLGMLKKNLKQVQSLKRPNELSPRFEDQIKFDKEFQRKMAESFKEAQKGSIAEMFAKVTIKEGKGWFGFYQGAYSGVSWMKHFSESIELPRGDVLDVVGASIKRHVFRNARRGQQ